MAVFALGTPLWLEEAPFFFERLGIQGFVMQQKVILKKPTLSSISLPIFQEKGFPGDAGKSSVESQIWNIEGAL